MWAYRCALQGCSGVMADSSNNQSNDLRTEISVRLLVSPRCLTSVKSWLSGWGCVLSSPSLSSSWSLPVQVLPPPSTNFIAVMSLTLCLRSPPTSECILSPSHLIFILFWNTVCVLRLTLVISWKSLFKACLCDSASDSVLPVAFAYLLYVFTSNICWCLTFSSYTIRLTVSKKNIHDTWCKYTEYTIWQESVQRLHVQVQKTLNPL